jgi:hypothetical protein
MNDRLFELDGLFVFWFVLSLLLASFGFADMSLLAPLGAMTF